MVMNLFFGTERRVRALLEPYVPSTAVPAWVQPDLATRSFKLSCARYSYLPPSRPRPRGQAPSFVCARGWFNGFLVISVLG